MKTEPTAADYIVPLHINGMAGRILKAPATGRKKREILLLYGHHALLERWWGLAQNLQPYGNVTMPDLPGFGGMDSFYDIGQQATIDDYADYMAAFIKMYYKRKRFTIIGISFGFVVATRMLQRYPELTKKVDSVVSMVGFMHRDDFLFPPKKRVDYHIYTRVLGARPLPFIIRYCFLNSFVVQKVSARLPAAKKRLADKSAEYAKEYIAYDVKLWQMNDVRTHWRTTSEFLNLDNCQTTIDLPVLHIQATGEHYFDNDIVEQHMRVVFRSYESALMKSAAHTPTLLANKTEHAVMVPPRLRKWLSQTG
ncbi:alpha/beta fold hydrolase [Candidatus Saccharibacteria bacterium]|jgi:pimeloyl-ACP methyl ester carboxylesterase|nr:alpha/beta fold hydrolase [Candidatus Saccharibacteria bacterium]